MTGTAATALLVTGDESLLDDVLRLAAAAGVILDVAHDTASALRSWGSAAVLLVGADLVPRLAEHQPVRRDAVHVVGRAPASDGILRAALALGAQNVAELPAAETWLVELLTDLGDGGSAPAVTIAVTGGSGGSGATTFSAALALTAAAAGERTLLVDADPLGGGIDRVVGSDDLEGVRWDALTQTTGRLSSRSLRDALPRCGALAVLTWAAGESGPLDPFAVREVLSAAQRGHDVVVVDVPRYPDPTVDEVLGRCDHTVLVAGHTVPSLAAAGRAVVHLQRSSRRIHLVTRGREGAVAGAELARMLGAEHVAWMPDQRRLQESVDLGLGPIRSRRGPLARTARVVLARLHPAAGRAA